MDAKEIQKLRDERAKLVSDMRVILDLADTEKRDITGDENTNYENMEKRLDELDPTIKTEEDAQTKKEERLAALAQKEEDLKRSQREPTKLDPNTDPDPEKRTIGPEELRLYEPYRTTEAYDNAFHRFLVTQDVSEFRALQADVDVSGGFIATPEKFTTKLIQALDDVVFARQYATVVKLPKAESLSAAELGADISDTEWTAEIKTGGYDSDMAFERRRLTPHPLGRAIKVSKTLLRKGAINIEALIRERLAYKFGIVEENAFLNGTGANQPLGVFVAHASGISTGRDEAGGNTTTAVKADNLINCTYKLKLAYRKTARWLFHRDLLKMIRKLKTGEGEYIWIPGLATGRPNTIVDLPYDESEYAPNTLTTGLYVGLLANWKHYWIVDALDMTIQVVMELFAATNQNAYFGRKETDGAPVLEEAFVRVKLG